MKTLKIFTTLFLISVNSILFAQNEVSTSELYSKIDTYLEAGTKNGFAGAIAVIKNGEVVINKGYGFANRNTQSLNNPNTIFDIGSNTKQFTAIAVLKLVELGKIRLTDSLSSFFKNISDDKKSITIHQLLSHSSGLVDVIGKDFTEVSKEDFLEQLFATQLLFKPGEKYSYSNTGYSICLLYTSDAADE